MMQENLTRDDGSIRDVNLTALIDVCLVLVTILLLATPMSFESNLSIHSARAAAADADTPTQGKPLLLAIVSEDSVRVDGLAMARHQLEAQLKPLLVSRTSPRVVVTCEDSVTHGAFVDIIDRAKSAGATEIAVAGR